MPGAFTLENILNLTASGGKNWSYVIDNQIVQLRADSAGDYLTQGQSVVVSFRTTVADDTTGAHEFVTQAWQDRDRNADNNMAAGYTNPVVIVGDPVSSEADLADMDLDGHYILTNDIDLEYDWIPIGARTDDEGPFTGSLHGNGYTINDMYIELPSASDSEIGMFTHTNGAWLVDINLNDLSIYIDDAASASNNKYYHMIGGLVGHAEDTSIVNSSLSGDISIYVFNDGGNIFVESVGGIAGYINSSTISKSHADVNIDLYLNAEDNHVDTYFIGGLSGLSGGLSRNSEVGGSYAAGSINVHQFVTDAGGSPGNTMLYGVGGLVGYQGSSSTVNMSYSAVEITGRAEGNIENMDFNSIGGLVGDNHGGDITNSYALGSLELSGDSTYHGLYAIGGLVGRNRNNGSIENSYATGNMVFDFSGQHYELYGPTIGGLVGVNEEGGTVTFSFYDSQTTGQNDDSDKGVPLTTAQMQQASNFRNAYWSITGGSGHYPRLWWEYDPDRPQTVWHIETGSGLPFLPPCTCPYGGGSGGYRSPCSPISSSIPYGFYASPLLHDSDPKSDRGFRLTGLRPTPSTGGNAMPVWAALAGIACGIALLAGKKGSARRRR